MRWHRLLAVPALLAAAAAASGEPGSSALDARRGFSVAPRRLATDRDRLRDLAAFGAVALGPLGRGWFVEWGVALRW